MSRTPAVLLISPGIVRWTDMDFGLPHLVALGGWLREKLGVRVEILDLNYEGGDQQRLARTLDELGPFVCIGISAYSSFDLLRVHGLAKFLKQRYPDAPIVGGGYHASALPNDLLGEQSAFDAVVIGEGELPFQRIVSHLLGGGTLSDPPADSVRIGPKIWGSERVENMDDLPPYAWDLLDRYWPRATDLGRKLQIYLSRGCPYHCTFCMERSKSGYSWRGFAPERAVNELERLAARTEIGRWVVNIADPLFGFHRKWRREVLEGILKAKIVPRQFWTLTRSDDLDETDVSLLAKGRFSIGIGMESGSPAMLEIMQKGNQPARYLDALRRLARLSRVHGLSWAANVIVGHPGETMQSMQETHAFVRELFLSAKETCGWVSIDPFRLYPGAAVYEQRSLWEARHGAKFHHPRWWWNYYDGPFLAQHNEPSSSLTYEQRVRFMVDNYGPLVSEVQQNFRGQGRSIDRVFFQSLEEQRLALTPAHRDRLIAMGKKALQREHVDAPILAVPIGAQLKDPWVRKRETAIRRLIDEGVLRTSRLIEALLVVPPEQFMSEPTANAFLDDRPDIPSVEGVIPGHTGLRAVAIGIEALAPGPGDHVADITAENGWLAAVFGELVGPSGKVVAVHSGHRAQEMRRSLQAWPQVEVIRKEASRLLDIEGSFDGLWIGAAMPKAPASLLNAVREPDGRVIAFLGPRFRPQDLVVLTRHGDRLDERAFGRIQVGVLGGPAGWVPAVRRHVETSICPAQWPAASLWFGIWAGVDLGDDRANSYLSATGTPTWAPAIAEAWTRTPNALSILALGLQFEAIDELEQALIVRGGALCEALLAAIRAEREGFEQGWAMTARLRAQRLDGVSAQLETLHRWRQWLWTVKGPPPPLLLLDVPALGAQARAATVGERRVVAADLGRAEDLLLLQILHEEVHPITDPVVLRDFTQARETQPGTPGFVVHRELERVAVAATEAFLKARDPQWIPAFERWVESVRSPALGAPLPSSAAPSAV